MVVVKRPVDEDIENTLVSYSDRFQELRAEISDLRKSGKDTLICELRTLEFGPLLRMAQTTYEKYDILRVKKALAVLTQEVVEVREGSDFRRVYNLIEQSNALLREQKREQARELYGELTTLYRQLPIDEQKSVYKACLSIHDRLQQRDSNDARPKAAESKQEDDADNPKEARKKGTARKKR